MVRARRLVHARRRSRMFDWLPVLVTSAGRPPGVESGGRPRVAWVGVGSGGGTGIIGPAQIGCTLIFTLLVQLPVNFIIVYLSN